MTVIEFSSISLPLLYEHLFRRTLIPLFFFATSPNWTLLLSYIVVQKRGSLADTFSSGNGNLISILGNAWSAVDWLDGECWAIVLGLFVWAAVTMQLLPGKLFYGPLTPKNFRPVYYDTAVAYYFLTLALVCPLIWYCSVAHLYFKFTTLTGILILTGSVITVLLYIKGLYLSNAGDREVTGNPVWDLFCGVELYPTAGPYISLKALIVCRFGLLLWQLVVLVAAKASYELSGNGQLHWPVAAITLIQTVYLAKNFYWEDGYMQSFDITFEHLGFYTGWGCMVILPTLYPFTSLYFVEHCPLTAFDNLTSVLSVTLGLGLVAATYWADYQRQVVRATDGDTLIWGQKPTLIRAKYTDQSGAERRSVLLASGFWAIGRHFNYTTEILIYLAIGLPALATSLLPYLTFLFVVVVLSHRATRDDRKCALKYGKYWEEYCSLVPALLVPRIF